MSVDTAGDLHSRFIVKRAHEVQQMTTISLDLEAGMDQVDGTIPHRDHQTAIGGWFDVGPLLQFEKNKRVLIVRIASIQDSIDSLAVVWNLDLEPHEDRLGELAKL